MSGVERVPAEAVEAAYTRFCEREYRRGGHRRDDMMAAILAALPLLREGIAAEVLGPIRAAVKARLDRHDFNESWDRGYIQGLKDAIYDINEQSAVPSDPTQAAEPEREQIADRDCWQKVAADIMQHFRSIGSNVSDTYVALVMSEAWKRRTDLVPATTLSAPAQATSGCDVCGKPSTHVTTPGGMRGCDDHFKGGRS